MATYNCKHCPATFESSAYNPKYCSQRCQDAAYRKRRRLRHQLGVAAVPYRDVPENDPINAFVSAEEKVLEAVRLADEKIGIFRPRSTFDFAGALTEMTEANSKKKDEEK